MTSGGQNENFERNAALVAYYATHSIKECAFHFSISVATVSQVLHRLGTVVRPQGTRLGPLGDARRITRLKEFAVPLTLPRIPEAPKAVHFRTATEMAHAANLKAAGSGGRAYTSAANQPARTIPTARKAAVPQGGSPGRQGVASAR